MSRLPVEEEGRLHDARLRENFIERVFSLRGRLISSRKRRITGASSPYIPGKNSR